MEGGLMVAQESGSRVAWGEPVLRHGGSSPKTSSVVLILKPSLQDEAAEEAELQPPQPRMQTRMQPP